MPPRIRPSITPSSLSPSAHTHCKSCLRRSLSSTSQQRAAGVPQTNLRKRMFQWLEGPGQHFKQPNKDYQTHYLPNYKAQTGYLERVERVDGLEKPADRQPVFPMNREFFSESILSESLRLEVWKRVQVDKQSVRQVSAELGIDMRRVGAVVRLVEVEKKMRAEGKQLAIPYAEAIHQMVPVTDYNPSVQNPRPHESINDLPHHPLTAPQIFYPTSESRAFNRTDAGRVFSAAPRLPDSQDVGQGGSPVHEPWEDTRTEIVGKRGFEMPVLKPADARIPHSHLIKHEEDKLRRKIYDEAAVKARYEERLKVDAARRANMHAAKAAREEATKTRVQTKRWEFVVTDVQAGEKGVGMRYGVPSQDRKRGNVRIPTKVEV